jgi:hypothetical protein
LNDTAKALGATVSTDTKNKNVFYVKKGLLALTFTLGSEKMKVNGKTKSMCKENIKAEIPKLSKKKTICVPLTALTENLGIKSLNINMNNNLISIATNKVISVSKIPYPYVAPNQEKYIGEKWQLTDADKKRLAAYPENVGTTYKGKEFYVPRGKVIEHMENMKIRAFNPEMYPPDGVIPKGTFGKKTYDELMVNVEKYVTYVCKSDYRMSLDDLCNIPKPFFDMVDSNRVNLETTYKNVQSSKAISTTGTRVEPSLTYGSNNGTFRVRGVVRYFVEQCNEVEGYYGKGTKVKKWIQEDFEAEFGNNSIGWFRLVAFKIHTLSKTPKILN